MEFAFCPPRTAAEGEVHSTGRRILVLHLGGGCATSFGGMCMEPGSLRVVNIDDQRWVVRAVRRLRTQHTVRELSLRFFNGAESRYVSDYPENWPVIPESDLTSLFQRAEPR